MAYKQKVAKKGKYIIAFDRRLKKRVLHKIEKGKAISLVTGSEFKYKGEKLGKSKFDIMRKERRLGIVE